MYSQKPLSCRTTALQVGKPLLEHHIHLAGQAGLSLGHRAVLGVQGSVDASSQVLGCGAPCSAAHGDPGGFQGLGRGGTDGSKLQGQRLHCEWSGTAPSVTSVSSQLSFLTSSG